MVEVTLIQRTEDTTKPKACWFPFQKQIKTRKKLSTGYVGERWVVDGIPNTKLSKSSSNSRRLCKSRSSNSSSIDTDSDIDRNLDRQERFHHKNGKSRGGSISTRTETDASFLSDESRTTAGTGTSSQGTYNKESHLSCGRNTTSDFSYRSNINSIVEKSFIDLNHIYNDIDNDIDNDNDSKSPSRSKPRLRSRSRSSNLRITKGEPSDSYNTDHGSDNDKNIIAKDPKGDPSVTINRHHCELDYQREKGRRGVLPAAKPATVETNCMVKEFWIDEAVEGGAFACLQAREKKLDSELDKQPQNDADSIILEKSLNRVKEVVDSSVTTGQKCEHEQPDKTNTSIHPFGRLMRFVSQDPEDTNGGASLRRILCSSVPFPNRNKPVLCQQHPKEGFPQQDGLDSDGIQIWQKHGMDVEERAVYGSPYHRNSDDEAPNFYVEVEAMREQLNGIRDLEEIRAESVELDEEIVNARASSLVDDDSAFTNSLEKNPKQDEKQQHKRKNLDFQRNKRNASSGVPILNSKGQRQDSKPNGMIRQSFQEGRQHEKISRQDKLLSEMVTDRVFAMRVENEIVSNSMERDRDGFQIAQTSSNLQREPLETGYRSHERREEPRDQGQSNKPFSNSSPPRTIEPSAQASSFNPLNVSELTELSYDQFASNWKTGTASTKKKNTSVHRNSSANAIQTWGNDEKKGDWQESEIGYYRRPNATSQKSIDVAFPPRRDHGTDGEKFDENFWKEDTDDLNSAEFEKYELENDSVFGDLRSQPSTQEFDPKSSKIEFEPFETDFQGNFGTNDGFGQHSLRKPKECFSKHSEAKLPNGNLTARTTYMR